MARRSLSVLASASFLRLAMMSSAVMLRIAAWSVELSVDHMGARKEKGAELDVAVLAAANAVLCDVVVGVLLFAGEAMLVDAREGKGGRLR